MYIGIMFVGAIYVFFLVSLNYKYHRKCSIFYKISNIVPMYITGNSISLHSTYNV